ncbi:alpha/beta fold hydrolase [Corynebacterium pseudopelargi]|uniref:alpha/beta fold hydrolase n=1 Tax=Corynebacterium pseudopelargi TaxID=2080757 RepID=UPI0013DDB691|nr:carboxylesterase family protein [Corynebacterium pseudopelargi]
MSTNAKPCQSPGTNARGQRFHGYIEPSRDQAEADVAIFDHIAYASVEQPFDAPTMRTEISQHVGRPDQCPLLLRVSIPADAELGEDLPIVAFIHGGGFDSGWRNEHWFHGGGLAAQRVMMVSIDYRLGVYGFARFPEDEPDSYRGISDCQTALDWLQGNAEAFGGDPTNVTLIGQSAGATIALWLCRKDHYKGTFRRAIALSPAFARKSFEQHKPRLRFALGRAITRKSLSKLSADKLSRGYRKYKRYVPTDLAMGPTGLDGAELADVPLILSCTEQEWFASRRTARIDARLPKALRPLVARHFHANANYVEHEAEEARFMAKVVGDSAIRRQVDHIAAAAQPRTWVIHYTGSNEQPAVHCCDIPWVLQSEAYVEPGTAEHIEHPAEHTTARVAQIVQDFLHGHLPDWPSYPEHRETLALNVATGAESISRDPFAHLRAGFSTP